MKPDIWPVNDIASMRARAFSVCDTTFLTHEITDWKISPAFWTKVPGAGQALFTGSLAETRAWLSAS